MERPIERRVSSRPQSSRSRPPKCVRSTVVSRSGPRGCPLDRPEHTHELVPDRHAPRSRCQQDPTGCCIAGAEKCNDNAKQSTCPRQNGGGDHVRLLDLSLLRYPREDDLGSVPPPGISGRYGSEPAQCDARITPRLPQSRRPPRAHLDGIRERTPSHRLRCQTVVPRRPCSPQNP